MLKFLRPKLTVKRVAKMALGLEGNSFTKKAARRIIKKVVREYPKNTLMKKFAR